MRMFQLTNLGQDISLTPDMQPSDAKRVLFYMHRHNGKATDEQLSNFVIQNKWELRKVIRDLVNVKAIEEIKI